MLGTRRSSTCCNQQAIVDHSHMFDLQMGIDRKVPTMTMGIQWIDRDIHEDAITSVVSVVAINLTCAH